MKSNVTNEIKNKLKLLLQEQENYVVDTTKFRGFQIKAERAKRDGRIEAYKQSIQLIELIEQGKI